MTWKTLPIILFALMMVSACGGGADATDDPDADPGGDDTCGDGVCDPGESCPADCGDPCTPACGASDTAIYCDENGEQASISCPADLGSSCDSSIAWCDCGSVTAAGACHDDAAAGVDLVVCEAGALTFYKCIPGSLCDVGDDGVANCFCDNADDGICPDAACTDDPDCQSCTPDCSNRACGDNGCGGSCGTCALGESCDAAGQCVVNDGGDGGDDLLWREELVQLNGNGDLWDIGVSSAFTPEPRAFVVGGNGIFVRNAAGQWLEDSDAPVHDWTSVWVSSTGTVPYAVSNDGAWAAFNDTLGWMERATSLGVLHDIGGIDGEVGEAWIVGLNGTIYRIHDFELSAAESPTLQHLSAVWAGDEQTAFAVGDEVILEWDGVSWTEVDSEVSAGKAFTDLHGTSATNLWAVAPDGTVIHRGAGGSFEVLAEQPPNAPALEAVWVSPDGDVWAVGREGVIVHWDGTTWSEEESGTNDRLWGIVGREARFGGTEVWALGRFGTVLYRAPASARVSTPAPPIRVRARASRF